MLQDPWSFGRGKTNPCGKNQNSVCLEEGGGRD